MIKGILGKKLGMTQVFSGVKGEAVTIIEAGPCSVMQLKTVARDGYAAAQLGFVAAKRPKTEAEKEGKSVKFRYVREFKLDDVAGVETGAQVDVSLFAAGEKIDVCGTSKGRGFAGVVKRHHFRGGPKTHGQSDRHRAPGSIGSTTTPGRVYLGTRMAGHMGNEKVTVRQLTVVQVIPEKNLLLVRGAVPGSKNGLVVIKKSGK